MYPFAEFLHLKLKFVEENPLRGIRIYTCNLIRGEPTRISQIVSNSHAPFRARNPSVSPISSQIVIRLYFVTLTELGCDTREAPEGNAMSQGGVPRGTRCREMSNRTNTRGGCGFRAAWNAIARGMRFVPVRDTTGG